MNWRLVSIGALLQLGLSIPTADLSQTDSLVDYFPLSVGSQWTYMNAISRGSDGPFPEMGRGQATALGILIGGSIGGAVGWAQGADTRYQMQGMDTETKKRLLNRLFPEASPPQ